MFQDLQLLISQIIQYALTFQLYTVLKQILVFPSWQNVLSIATKILQKKEKNRTQNNPED